MESLRASYNEEEDEEWSDALEHIPDSSNNNNNSHSPFSSLPPPPPVPPATSPNSLPPLPPPPPLLEDPGSKENGGNPHPPSNPTDPSVPLRAHDNEVEDNEEEEEEGSARKKQKPTSSSSSSPPPPPAPVEAPPPQPTKKPKKKSNNVWTKSSSRKGKKKNRSAGAHASATPEDTVLITPIPRFPDKSDDAPDACICLSRVYKAERVELSDDRLTAGSTKGYRMVRATRGVADGAWFFEIKVLHLGETGHTRLGWTTEKGDLQAPVGYDGNSFGYRDIDGTKVHKALREKYGEESYKEGDVIGFYINLPEGVLYLPKPPHLVWYKGQRYMYSADGKDEPPKTVPGSEISFFKNGVCQGVAFKDLFGGRYYPAASMYTLPNQPNCEVRFNFGPDFEFFPEDFGDHPIPQPMIEVAYHGYDARVDAPTENGVAEKTN